MHKKLWLSVVMAIAGASLLATAALATPAKQGAPAVKHVGKAGGTFVVEFSTDVDYTDPGLDYLSTGWELQYATACKLMNYPDKNGAPGSQLQPEVAAGFPKVSNSGKTYTFTIKPGYKFSNGQAVTAASFAAAFNRDANPKLQSPAQPFLSDIVGADAMINGKASSIAGIKASCNTITFTLTGSAPDFLARTSMPFFQAIPNTLASQLDPNGANAYPGCGPYYFADRVPNKSITLKRNPFYKGPRPHNVNEIDVKIGNSLDVIEQNVKTGATDYAAQGIPPNDFKSVADQYGVNKGQFWVKPQLGIRYLAMNHDRPLFKNNPNLAKAVNYAIDRRAISLQGGYLEAQRSDHILPPGMAGSRPCNCYPLNVTPQTIAKAKSLAQGHTGGGSAVLWTSNRGAAPLQAQIYQYNLKQIGLDVSVQLFARAVQIEKEGTRGADFDFTAEGWIADYADPFDFINVLLSGDSLHDSNNNNIAYFNDPKYNAQMRAAARLSGPARYKAYGDLDIDITKNNPAWAVRANLVDRLFVSKRTGCFTFNPVFSFDYAAACIK
jgi:ABC-type oligopeptide transport system substrate-binding subunit